MLISPAFAQAAGATPESSLMSFLPLILMFVVLYFLMIRPQMKRAKEHKAMIGALNKGDEVVTAAGVVGKITEVDSKGIERTVHRMGDLAWQDSQGRLWFCGRKSQRLQTAQGLLGTENVEPIFNNHPAVRRSALVGIGAYGEQQPVLCIEREPSQTMPEAQLKAELLAIAGTYRHTGLINTFLIHPGFPVDIRHNAKIGREQLTRWATQQLARKP